MLSPRLRLGKMLMKSRFQKSAGFTGVFRFSALEYQENVKRSFYLTNPARAEPDVLLILHQSNKNLRQNNDQIAHLRMAVAPACAIA